MTIRDLAVTQRCAWLDELISVCVPGGAVSTKCPALAADITRKSNAMKGVLLRLSQALSEAGPPPVFAAETRPLYERLSERPELVEVARLVGHHGVPEDELYELTKRLAGQHGNDRVSRAMAELIWVDAKTRWARLRPEVIRVCRPVIGPVPGAEDYDLWWAGKKAPAPRSPETEKEKVAARPAKKKRAKAKG